MDRTSIDWVALRKRTRDPGERASLEALRDLDELRGRTGAAAAPADYRPGTVLCLLLAVATVQTACGLAAAMVALATGRPLVHLLPHLLLTCAFASASLLLASASPRDRRVFFLLATFALAGGAFARAMMSGLPGHWPPLSSPMFRGIFPEAFVQAALWRFAVVFPAVHRFTAVDLWARRAAAVAWGVASCLFLANVLLAHGVMEERLDVLGRDHPGNLFWHLFAMAALPAVATILIRAYRAPRRERAKVARFAYAIGAGTAPLLLAGLARLLLPGVNRWMLTDSGVGRLWVDVTIVGALAAMPVLTTLAVIVDRPFVLQTILPAALRRWAARWHVRFSDTVRLRSFGRHSHRERLTAALDRVRLTRGAREIADVLCRELQFGVGARAVRILDIASLPSDTALATMLEGSSAPIDLSRESEPFVLLPQRDRDWLEVNAVALAAALRLRDGTVPVVAVLGTRRGGAPFNRADRWFISTLLTGAAAAWDAGIPPGPSSHPSDDVALECSLCGLVGDVSPIRCGCAAAATLAALPQRVADRFLVTRRLGAGGMGVVYLGRDITLGREVALKTLPALRDGMVSRLRDEARVMAALNHDALATIYSLEVWRHTPVLVLEYFPCGTLADRLARRPMTIDEVLTLGIRVADALTYMHSRGVLHRDLKPSNIGLTLDGAAKLLDFGLATGSEWPAGTPQYLPPEALQGAPPDAAVDLWALATVLLKASGGPADQPIELTAFFDRALATDPALRLRSSAEMWRALRSLIPDP
ncbi:MAG: serine/threonine protein kinase [Acidobacteria bacterium]|nr:serine/threonine protein kinase [Acidobacteriota bacterium]